MRLTKDNKHYEGKDLEVMVDAVHYYNWLISEFGDYIGKNIAEVGAGAGTFTNYLLRTEKIKKIYSIEPSKEMVPLLREQFENEEKVEVLNGFFKDHMDKFKQKLDTVFYINVLEHVEDDTKELKMVYNSLKKGGYICIYVPALQLLYGAFDRRVGHFRRYHKSDLRVLLTNAGFEVINNHYSDIVGVVPWMVMFKMLRRSEFNPMSVSLYDKFVIPLIRLQEKVIKPPFGKNLWAVGRKV